MADRPSADRTAELLFWYARKPSRFQEEARRRDAPRLDPEVVLKLALGRSVKFTDASWVEPVTADALGQAARAYVRQLFFRPDATPYQVLGLEPGASPEQIKECFRLLMQLVHPDRQGEKRRWPDACAAQANWAHSMLREQQTRRTFEEEAEARAALQRAINRAAMAAAASRMPTVVWPKKSAKDRFAMPTQILPEWLTVRVGGYVRRHPATTAFGTLIAIAVLIIGASLWEGSEGSLVRVAREEPQMPSPVAPTPMPASEAAAMSATRPTDPALPPTARAGDERPILLASTSPAVDVGRAPAGVAALAAVPASPPAPVAHPASSASQPAVPPSAPQAQAPTAFQQTAPPAAPQPQAQPVVVAIDAPSASSAVAAEAPSVLALAPPADKEVEAVLANFVDSYERGRVDAFAALFDDAADTNLRHGRTAIRSEYDELFRLSQWRRMQLTQISWRPVGDRAVAKGELTVKIGWRDGRQVEQRVNVDMELVRRDGRVLIAKLAHQAKNP